jgi:hypothetical protein
VASTIDLIFRKFAELGSVRQAYFWFDQQHIELPVARGPEEVREIVWQPARYHTVLSVLKNPVYAGAYAYGRSKTVVRLDAGQKRVRRQVQRRREDWAVLIMDHHESYIDWDVYQSNQTMIAHNDNARDYIAFCVGSGPSALSGFFTKASFRAISVGEASRRALRCRFIFHTDVTATSKVLAVLDAICAMRNAP